MATKGEKRRDRALYGRLIESYQADRISVFIDLDHLNAPKSPVFGPCENGAPMPIIILLVTGAMVLLVLLLRTLAMALGVLVYLFLVYSWISKRAYRRAIDAATDNLHNWNVLWKLGDLALTLNYMPKTRYVSPGGD